jgi:hypothetical protein
LAVGVFLAAKRVWHFVALRLSMIDLNIQAHVNFTQNSSTAGGSADCESVGRWDWR